MGAAPYPMPSSRQFVGRGMPKPLPHGPMRSTNSCADDSASHDEPAPLRSTMSSTVPAHPPRRDA